MKRSLVFLFALLMGSVAVAADPVSTELPQPPDDRATLASIFNDAKNDLAQLESLMRSRNYDSAMTKAKQSLDSVRIRSGIHPKASYREKIPMKAGGLMGSYSGIGMAFKGLSIDAQDNVALTVANHRAGYFLDILNLMKRTNLIYIKSFHKVLKSRGKLLQRDIDKIKEDIMDVHAIPLYLKDSSYAAYFLVFDFEVAQSDQNYLFNRELMDYLLEEGRDLKIKNEAAVEAMLSASVNKTRTEFINASTGQQTSSPAISTPSRGGNIFESANYKECYRIYEKTQYSHVAASNCQALVPRHNFRNSEFQSCYVLYERTQYSHVAAGNCLRYAK